MFLNCQTQIKQIAISYCVLCGHKNAEVRQFGVILKLFWNFSRPIHWLQIFWINEVREYRFLVIRVLDLWKMLLHQSINLELLRFRVERSSKSPHETKWEMGNHLGKPHFLLVIWRDLFYQKVLQKVTKRSHILNVISLDRLLIPQIFHIV